MRSFVPRSPALLVAVLAAGLAVACGRNDSPTERRYAEHCAACHSTGASGAPRRGDAAAWAPLRERGIPSLLESVKRGTPAMPAKGRCERCTDEELQALIRLMSE
ncbi:MAG: cytochrome c5 family protein [Myxococcales bacterium]|nr:cytochrome c5 family protein [Myxococcales bacterium]